MMANGSLQGGGAEHVIATLSKQLRTRGHRVSIAALSSGGEVLDALRSDGFEIVGGLSRAGLLGFASMRGRIGRLVRERHVDIIHTHDLRSLVDIGACRQLARCFRHVHTFHFGNYPHLPRKNLALERFFARAADRLVAVGYAQRDALVRTHGLDPARVQVVWNGIEAPPEAQESGPGGHAACAVPVVGSVSAFFPQKGLPTLLEAARIVQEKGTPFHLVLVGDGPLRKELEGVVSRLGIADVVEFAGWIPDAARAVLPTLDVFVQSSDWEAMSVVVLEAMAAGRPIVATAVGDNARVLTDGETGILVPPGDPDALATALMRVLQDKALRERLGRGALASFRRSFTATAMSERYVGLYEEEVARR